MRTYVVQNQLAVLGPVRSHMIRKLMSVGQDTLVTTSCSRTFEYSRTLGTDADARAFHMSKGSNYFRVIDPNMVWPRNKCSACGWPGEERKKIVRISVEVVCAEDSELERFVRLFNHKLLAEAGHLQA